MQCCGEVSNTSVLGYVFLLNLCITAAQAFAAIQSNSLALLMDDVQMGIDTFSYAVNWFSEYQRLQENGVGDRLEVLSSGFSIVVLLLSVYGGAVEAFERLTADEKTEGKVQMNIVFVFAIIGLLVDFISLSLFYSNKTTQSYSVSGGSSNEEEARDGIKPGQLNMCTACLHSGADLMRSITTLSVSLCVLTFGGSSSKADAWASLIVSASIILVAAVVAKDLMKLALGLTAVAPSEERQFVEERRPLTDGDGSPEESAPSPEEPTHAVITTLKVII